VWVGLRVGCEDAARDGIDRLGNAGGTNRFEFFASVPETKTFDSGRDDEFASRANIESLFATLPDLKKLVVVEDADHFFAGHLQEVSSAIHAWIAERHPAATADRPAINFGFK